MAAEPNPFFDPTFVLPAATGMEANPVLLVAIGRSGAWLGAMPVWHGRGWRRLPIRGFGTWRHPYGFFGAPLVRPGEELAVLEAWLQPGHDALTPFLGFDGLDANGPLSRALKSVCGEYGRPPIVVQEHDRAALQRGEQGLNLGMTAKRRRESARLSRRLAESLGGSLEIVDRAAEPEAVEEFLRLESAGWKGAEGTALACRPGHPEFFREACRGFRENGSLQLLTLQVNERIAAMKCNFLARDTIFCFKTAFDESLAEFSPGVQLERALVDYVSDDERVALIDTCAEGNNEMANRVWSGRRRIATLIASSRGLRGTLCRPPVRGLVRTRTTIRRTP